MAKASTKKASTEVATRKSNLPAKTLDEMMERDAGKGVSNKQEDNLVPLIYVMQALSPQINKKHTKYVKGAELGDILLRSAPEPVVKGEEGMLFQPCYFSKDWVEWVPRDDGGGLVGRHNELPEEAKKVKDKKNPNKIAYVMPNDNEVVETRYHIGYVYQGGKVMPYVIPLHGSGHSVSKDWMFRMNAKTTRKGVAPSYSHLYLLKTKERSNSAGQNWYVFDVQDVGRLDSEETAEALRETSFKDIDPVEMYERGEKLHDAFEGGEKKIEEPDETVQTERSSGSSDDNKM